MKTLTTRQFATVKRVAQNVNPLVVKRNKIANKIGELNEAYISLTEEIESHEMGIKTLTEGFTSENLVIKKVENTGKVDKNGCPVKIIKYEPNTDIIVFNEETHVYEIHVPLTDSVNTNTVDDTEKVHEKELLTGTVSAEAIGEAYLEGELNNRLGNNF